MQLKVDRNVPYITIPCQQDQYEATYHFTTTQSVCVVRPVDTRCSLVLVGPLEAERRVTALVVYTLLNYKIWEMRVLVSNRNLQLY